MNQKTPALREIRIQIRVGKIERGKSLSMIVIKTKILTNTLTLDLPKKDKVLSLL